jgi:hypothetical protein
VAGGIDVSINDFYDARNVQIVPTGSAGSIAVFERESGAPSLDVIAKRLNDDGSLGDLLATGDVPAIQAVPLRAYPNPFRSGVYVTLEGGPAGANADILDAAGRRVRSLGEIGSTLSWDGRDALGRPVSPGVYFVRLAGTARALRLVRVR